MKIAVIGSGISGLSAAWLLSQRHEVTLYESNRYLGGHTNTVDVTLDGVTAPVDTGFLVFNSRTYHNLMALFRTLEVEWTESDMSFSVQVAREGIEWAGTNLFTLFAQPKNLFNRRFLGMLQDILRFNRQTTRLLSESTINEISLGAFLKQESYSNAFRDWYLLPMAAAIWSCPASKMLDYPLRSFVQFCHNHGLLQVLDRPTWYTVNGGGRTYVERLRPLIGSIKENTTVVRVERSDGKVLVESANGTEDVYHQVVMACHADQTLSLLEGVSEQERRLLSSFTFQPNRAVLHWDENFLPTSKAAWSAWNYHIDNDLAHQHSVSVTYLINRLQPLPFKHPVMVTLNPDREVRPDRVLREFLYQHPVFDEQAVAAQRKLPSIQGAGGVWYGGAWTGYGFHEDGLKSALVVANALGCYAPWQERLAA